MANPAPSWADEVHKILREPGPVLADIKVSTERGAPAVPPRDGPVLRYRFRQALPGDKIALE